MPPDGISPKGSSGIRLNIRNRVTHFIRQEVVVSEVRLENFLTEPFLFIHGAALRRLFARMTTGAALSKHSLTAVHHALILCDVVGAAGRVLQVHRTKSPEELLDVLQPFLSCHPIN